jgi:hypothetical protein
MSSQAVDGALFRVLRRLKREVFAK